MAAIQQNNTMAVGATTESASAGNMPTNQHDVAADITSTIGNSAADRMTIISQKFRQEELQRIATDAPDGGLGSITENKTAKTGLSITRQAELGISNPVSTERKTIETSRESTLARAGAGRQPSSDRPNSGTAVLPENGPDPLSGLGSEQQKSNSPLRGLAESRQLPGAPLTDPTKAVTIANQDGTGAITLQRSKEDPKNILVTDRETGKSEMIDTRTMRQVNGKEADPSLVQKLQEANKALENGTASVQIDKASKVSKVDFAPRQTDAPRTEQQVIPYGKAANIQALVSGNTAVQEALTNKQTVEVTAGNSKVTVQKNDQGKIEVTGTKEQVRAVNQALEKGTARVTAEVKPELTLNLAQPPQHTAQPVAVPAGVAATTVSQAQTTPPSTGARPEAPTVTQGEALEAQQAPPVTPAAQQKQEITYTPAATVEDLVRKNQDIQAALEENKVVIVEATNAEGTEAQVTLRKDENGKIAVTGNQDQIINEALEKGTARVTAEVKPELTLNLAQPPQHTAQPVAVPAGVAATTVPQAQTTPPSTGARPDTTTLRQKDAPVAQEAPPVTPAAQQTRDVSYTPDRTLDIEKLVRQDPSLRTALREKNTIEIAAGEATVTLKQDSSGKIAVSGTPDQIRAVNEGLKTGSAAVSVKTENTNPPLAVNFSTTQTPVRRAEVGQPVAVAGGELPTGQAQTGAIRPEGRPLAEINPARQIAEVREVKQALDQGKTARIELPNGTSVELQRSPSGALISQNTTAKDERRSTEEALRQVLEASRKGETIKVTPIESAKPEPKQEPAANTVRPFINFGSSTATAIRPPSEQASQGAIATIQTASTDLKGAQFPEFNRVMAQREARPQRGNTPGIA